MNAASPPGGDDCLRGTHLFGSDGRCRRFGCQATVRWAAPPTMPQAARESGVPDADRLTLSRLAGAADGAVGAMLEEALRVRDQHRVQIDALKARVVELEAEVNTARLAVEAVGSSTLIEQVLTRAGFGAEVAGSPSSLKTMFGRVADLADAFRDRARRHLELEVVNAQLRAALDQQGDGR
jgi:hypothetical protein